MINIPQTVSDPFYRYQRPKVSIEKQKLGIRIPNIDTLGKSIYLKPGTIMKFWQKKVGCQSKKDILYSKKSTVNELDNLLEELIVMLLCPKCENPEFDISREKKKINIKCKACGNERATESDLKKLLEGEC